LVHHTSFVGSTYVAIISPAEFFPESNACLPEKQSVRVRMRQDGLPNARRENIGSNLQARFMN
jgi:hypothetical protein